MNKIQIKSNEKVQRKRRTRAVAIPQLAASKISHKDTDYAGARLAHRPPFHGGRPAAAKGVRWGP